MVYKQQPAVTPREHETRYERTVVIGDIHGDLDALLVSLAAKGVVRYEESDLETVLRWVQTSLKSAWSKNLESLVVRQEPRLQLVFLGDLVDRWSQGCHVLQFVSKVRWERFGIDAVFLAGNHDVLNLHFFINPYLVYWIYRESEFSLDQRTDYIGRMGIGETLKGFLELHKREILALQREFYKTGVLEWDLGYGKLTLRYNRDLSVLLGYDGNSWDDMVSYCERAIRAFGSEPQSAPYAVVDELVEHLGAHENPGGQNWWSIEPTEPEGHRDYIRGYQNDLHSFNIFYDYERQDYRGFDRYRDGKFRNVLPIDWRLISLVWRRHYGDYFRRVDQLHRDGATLFSHAGISPQALVDSQAFGVIYRLGRDEFVEYSDERFYNFDRALERVNRLTRQVFTNALNDYSFSCMSGAEITDLMGVWRGGRYGFTHFGGLYWADCEYIQHSVRHEEDGRMLELYRKFVEGTPIRRVICGHTRFGNYQEPELRYRQIEKLTEVGLDFLSVDNGCSKGYRGETNLNGIEYDSTGKIADPGRFWSDWG